MTILSEKILVIKTVVVRVCVCVCAVCEGVCSVCDNQFISGSISLPHGYFELEDGGERIWESLCYLSTKDNWGRYIKKIKSGRKCG